MSKGKLFILGILISFTCFLFSSLQIWAEDEKSIDEIQKEIEEYERRIDELRGEQETLANAIAYLDNNIGLTETQILATEEKLRVLGEDIKNLGIKIEDLDFSLDSISEVFTSRITAIYKRSKVKPLYLFFSSSGFGEFYSKVKYLRLMQEHDRNLLFQMEEARETFNQQKEFKEEKQEAYEELQLELKNQQAVLAQQRRDKQALLDATRSSEKEYQAKIASLVAELEAIQGIIAGRGTETEVGRVGVGEKIASIIPGSSACSTGGHLHFEVVKGDGHQNPGGFLKNKSVSYESGVSAMNFSGSWEWPVNDPIIITQEYGETLWTRTGQLWYKFHTGVDMYSDSSLMVKAVREGTLYRGSIACGGGSLTYVKVDHQDSDLDTYYLHVNYY